MSKDYSKTVGRVTGIYGQRVDVMCGDRVVQAVVRGKHITSGANLFKICPDGWVANTPGLKNLGLVGVNRKNLHHYFPEFAPFEKDCHFSDCLHIGEPNCGIKRALNNQDPAIAEFRYRNYSSIYKSLNE